MALSLSLTILISLFLVLSFSADQVAKNLRVIAVKLGLPIFLLGLVLGLLTSFPEGAIAINAMINGVQGLSIGNLFGGIVVMFSLVLGIGVILNKEINNDGRLGYLALCFVYILLPFFLAIKGSLNYLDGILLIALYFILLARLYQSNHQMFSLRVALVSETKVIKETLIVMGGIILILLSSHYIIEITGGLLKQYNLSPFLIGLIFFPLGTNLPELTVAIASWRRKDKELSFSNLLGSAVANTLMVGALVTIKTYSFNQNYNYLVTFIFIALLAATIIFFYRSGKKLSRWEGIILVAIYVVYMFFQFQSDPLHL